MSDSRQLGLPYLAAAQSQKHVTHNEALAILDACIHLSVVSRSVAAPPASPADGARYIVGASPTGAFAGRGGQIAVREDGAWRFLSPKTGWRAYVESENCLSVFDGTVWQDLSLVISSLQNLSRLGIGTTADATNPLSAKLNAALFTALTLAEGGAGDLRFKLNKETVSKTVSQLYQSGYSARAETGLIGDDHFRIKVSSDGATWRQAVDIDPASGVVTFPSGVSGVTAAAPTFQWSGTQIRFQNPDGSWGSWVDLRGASGSQILATSGAPSSGVGANGDWALDATGRQIYGPKAAGSWPGGASLGGLSLRRVDTLTSSGTYTKQSGDVLYRLRLWGSGGGGGSGRRSASGTQAGGGGGGGPGCYVERWVSAGDFGATINCLVGAAGAGGASVAADDANGGAGSDGGYTSFGLIVAYGGKGGGGGTTSGGAGGSRTGGAAYSLPPRVDAASGGAGASSSNAASFALDAAPMGAGGGAGGGGLTAANAVTAFSLGQAGDYTIALNGGSQAGSGATGRAANFLAYGTTSGNGGNGGASALAAAADPGGVGGGPGGGGGGGGASRNGYPSGAGGNGAAGKIIVEVFG